jgi:glucose-1-phosphate adenylyltransferase
VIYTRMRFLPASRVGGATLKECLISDGCVVEPGAHIERSLLGVRSRIGQNVVLRDSIVIGADRFETDAERAANRRQNVPDFTIGEGSIIERAIVDKDCRIGRNVRIVNPRGLQEDEGENYVIRDGIVVIPKAAIVPDGAVI